MRLWARQKRARGCGFVTGHMFLVLYELLANSIFPLLLTSMRHLMASIIRLSTALSHDVFFSPWNVQHLKGIVITRDQGPACWGDGETSKGGWRARSSPSIFGHKRLRQKKKDKKRGNPRKRMIPRDDSRAAGDVYKSQKTNLAGARQWNLLPWTYEF